MVHREHSIRTNNNNNSNNNSILRRLPHRNASPVSETRKLSLRKVGKVTQGPTARKRWSCPWTLATLPNTRYFWHLWWINSPQKALQPPGRRCCGCRGKVPFAYFSVQIPLLQVQRWGLPPRTYFFLECLQVRRRRPRGVFSSSWTQRSLLSRQETWTPSRIRVRLAALTTESCCYTRCTSTSCWKPQLGATAVHLNSN